MQPRMKLLVLFAITAAFSGCAQTSTTTQSLFGRSDSDLPKATSGRVARIVCLWEPAEGVATNGKPTRGFLGQVLFFTAGSDSPVVVDGDVEIYTFDDQGTPEEQARPLKKFRFSSEEWNQLAIESAVGIGYNVTIPHMRDNQLEATCALRVKFTSRDGAVTYSGLDSLTLKGKSNPNGLSMKRTRSKISAHEILKDKLGDLVDKSRSKDVQPKAIQVGGTSIQRTAGTDNALETLSIRTTRPARRSQASEPRSSTTGSAERKRRRFRLTSPDESVETHAATDADFAPLP